MPTQALEETGHCPDPAISERPEQVKAKAAGAEGEGGVVSMHFTNVAPALLYIGSLEIHQVQR